MRGYGVDEVVDSAARLRGISCIVVHGGHKRLEVCSEDQWADMLDH